MLIGRSWGRLATDQQEVLSCKTVFSLRGACDGLWPTHMKSNTDLLASTPHAACRCCLLPYTQGVETHLMMETSGHGAIKENYYLDDGAYLAVKV